MQDIVISPDLWSTSLLPEGILERWRAKSGDMVTAGQVVADVRISDSLHEIMAPQAGTLDILMRANAVVEPGSVIGEIMPALGRPKSRPLPAAARIKEK